MHGYIVVERVACNVNRTANPRYKGIYRMVPWSQSAYEAGFDDPLVFGPQLRDKAGLVPTLSIARQIWREYLKIRPADSMEFIWVRSKERASPAPPAASSFLGFDVACRTPFWSIVADVPNDAFVSGFLERLNDHGLFNTEDDSLEYLAAYRRAHPEHAAIELFVWEVHALPSDAEPETHA